MSMGRLDKETIAILKKQKAFEDATVERLTLFYNSTKNSIVKLFIHRIILDTMKHSDIYQSLIAVNSGAIVADIDKERMTKELTMHIREEVEMLNRAVEISKKMEDEKSRRLIEQVIEDERLHHKLLEELLEIVKKVEGMHREDWLEFYYDRAEWLF